MKIQESFFFLIIPLQKTAEEKFRNQQETQDLFCFWSSQTTIKTSQKSTEWNLSEGNVLSGLFWKYWSKNTSGSKEPTRGRGTRDQKTLFQKYLYITSHSILEFGEPDEWWSPISFPRWGRWMQTIEASCVRKRSLSFKKNWTDWGRTKLLGKQQWDLSAEGEPQEGLAPGRPDVQPSRG